MTFRKTVAAYLTGWLIVQPLYNRVYAWWRRREMEKPDGEYRRMARDLAVAVVEQLEERWHVTALKYTAEDVNLALLGAAADAFAAEPGTSAGEIADRAMARLERWMADFGSEA